MDKSNIADLIFEKWKASLRTRDRKISAVGSNFDELFEDLHKEEVPFEMAHNLLQKAIKAHLPNKSVIKNQFKLLKTNPKFIKSEFELEEEWTTTISDIATDSFFNHFELKKTTEDPDPKVFGSMSEKEYRAQRKHAEQFPVLNTFELEKRLLSDVYNPEDDLLNVLGNKDEIE